VNAATTAGHTCG